MNDLVMVRGDSKTFDINLVYANASVPDLSGATVAFIVDGLFTKTDQDGITIDESSGEATVDIDPIDTESCPSWHVRYRYNVEVTQADGTVLTTQRGRLTVVPDVTT